jgi:hypothetical protein
MMDNSREAKDDAQEAKIWDEGELEAEISAKLRRRRRRVGGVAEEEISTVVKKQGTTPVPSLADHGKASSFQQRGHLGHRQVHKQGPGMAVFIQVTGTMHELYVGGRDNEAQGGKLEKEVHGGEPAMACFPVPSLERRTTMSRREREMGTSAYLGIISLPFHHSMSTS